MRIGIAFDLKSDFESALEGPDDRLEEYDSASTVEGLSGALRELGHEPVALGSGRRFLERVLREPPDLVFNIAEGSGSRSREAHVPAACEMLRIPFTHSDPLTLALTLDKAAAKRVASSMGVATPRFAVVERVEDCARVALGWPVIAKPLFEGSSMGIRRHSRVTDQAGLRREVERIVRDYDQPALVEEFCSGPEFTVGLLGDGHGLRVVGAMEIVPRRARVEEFVYSLEVKRDWENEVEYHAPPKRDRGVIAAVEALALEAARALGCRDVARVDVRLDAHGAPRFLEVNPLPGMNPVTSDLAILARGVGTSYTELVGAIVASACARQGLS